MQSTASLVVVALASATAVSAQYAGQVFFKDKGDCPNGLQSETVLEWSTETGSQCLPNPFSSSSWSARLGGVLVGTTTIKPTRFGACPSSDCSSDCTSTDIVEGGSSVAVNCWDADNGDYIFIGY